MHLGLFFEIINQRLIRLGFVHFAFTSRIKDKVKTLNISSRLEDNITTHHMLHSSLARAEFFEYALKNPYPNDQVVIICTDDTELW